MKLLPDSHVFNFKEEEVAISTSKHKPVGKFSGILDALKYYDKEKNFNKIAIIATLSLGYLNFMLEGPEIILGALSFILANQLIVYRANDINQKRLTLAAELKHRERGF